MECKNCKVAEGWPRMIVDRSFSCQYHIRNAQLLIKDGKLGSRSDLTRHDHADEGPQTTRACVWSARLGAP